MYPFVDFFLYIFLPSSCENPAFQIPRFIFIYCRSELFRIDQNSVQIFSCFIILLSIYRYFFISTYIYIYMFLIHIYKYIQGVPKKNFTLEKKSAKTILSKICGVFFRTLFVQMKIADKLFIVQT